MAPPSQELEPPANPGRFKTLSGSLIRARSVLREAANSLRGYDGRDQSLLNIAEDVSETAQTIYDRMRKKFRNAMGDGRGS